MIPTLAWSWDNAYTTERTPLEDHYLHDVLPSLVLRPDYLTTLLSRHFVQLEYSPGFTQLFSIHGCGRIHRDSYFTHIVYAGKVRGRRLGLAEGRRNILSLLLYSPAQDGKHIKCFPLRAELATNLTPMPPVPGIRRTRRGNVPHQKKTHSHVGKRVFERAVNALGNYSSSLSLASSASSVSTSWLSSSSREAISSLMAPLTNPLVIWSPARTSQPSSSSNVRDCGSNDPRTSQLVQIGCRESWHRHISATTCLSTRMRVMRRHA